MFSFLRGTDKHSSFPIDLLDTPLFTLPKGDDWTMRDACNGLQIFGGIGSGKTSGSGNTVAKAFLEQGMGGLVLTAKGDETKRWLDYAEETGRSEDVIRFAPDQLYRFNFLSHAVERGEKSIENLVALFMAGISLKNKGEARVSNDSYWQDTAEQILRNIFSALLYSGEDVTLRNAMRIVHSAPQSMKDVTGKKKKKDGSIKDSKWGQTSYLASCLDLLEDTQYGLEEAGETGNRHWLNINAALDYWYEGYPQVPEQTRGIFQSMFSSMADSLMRDVVGELFGGITNVSPSESFDGKIIILDLPENDYFFVGTLAQVLFKYLWQREAISRPIDENTLPVFLWVDESQIFVTKQDVEFQGIARQYRVATVFLTQNINQYYVNFGAGMGAKERTEALLGNLQTHIYHTNSDVSTNEWAAKLMGQGFKKLSNVSVSQNQGGASQGYNIGTSINQQYHYHVPPDRFTKLKTGGPAHRFIVEGMMFRAGGTVFKDTKRNYTLVAFNQQR